MCLIVKKKVGCAEAVRPISCWKVVEKRGGLYVSCFGFYGRKVYTIGSVSREENMETSEIIPSVFLPMPLDEYKVTKGLHTFATPEAARTLYEWYLRDERERDNAYPREYAILECEIPAGAHYYRGRANVFKDRSVPQEGYVSDAVKPLRELDITEIRKIPFTAVPL